MSETRVKIPDLTTTEFEILVVALKFYHESQIEMVNNRELTAQARSEARSYAVLSNDLLGRIG